MHACVCSRRPDRGLRLTPDRRVDRHLQIQTPSAQAVVRGTRFRVGVGVGVGAEVSREETLRGRVGVSAAGRKCQRGPWSGDHRSALGEPPIKPVPLLAAPDAARLPARFEQLPLRFPVPQLDGGGCVVRRDRAGSLLRPPAAQQNGLVARH
jgi:hypothetical protein